MHGYLKGYFGYKNFGDELLLLGVIPWVFTHTSVNFLSIEAEDVSRLQDWLVRHETLDVLTPYQNALAVVPKHSVGVVRPDHIFFGGGEVLTDGRPFPYNGRNYLARYFPRVLSQKYTLLGGIGTPHNLLSGTLRKFLLRHAHRVVVREKRSFDVARGYIAEDTVTMYHDFAFDVLKSLSVAKKEQATTPPKVLININPYIRSDETKHTLVQLAERYTGANFRFFPAEYGVDDRFMDELTTIFPNLDLFDRQGMHIQEIVEQLSSFSFGIAARLHVLVVLQRLGIPFEPLVYQEKITTFLHTCSDESFWSSL